MSGYEDRPGPVLLTDTAAVLAQLVECELIVGSEERLISWVCGLELARSGTMKLSERGARRLASKPATLAQWLREDQGFQLMRRDSSQKRSGPIYTINVSNTIDEGGRRVHLDFDTGSLTGTGNVARISKCSALFEAAVADLQPVYAYLLFGSSSAFLFDSRYGKRRLANVGSYHWRNYITPELLDGDTLGDGSTLTEPAYIDVGAFPLVDLAHRDRVRHLLGPLFPPERQAAKPLPPELASRLQLATADGGVELPPDMVETLAAHGVT